MSVRFASPQEILQWNSLILANLDHGNVFQGMEFSIQKREGGWRTHYVMVDTTAVLVLEKTVFPLGKLWYVPKGPATTTDDDLFTIIDQLRQFAKNHGVFMIRIEPELLRSDDLLRIMTAKGLIKTTPIQPNFSTITLDVSPDIATILETLPQKGRYAIKRAQRDGVTATSVSATDENCLLMYELLRDTAQDAKFGIRPYEYYRSFWQRYEQAGLGQLFFAYFNDEVVAGAYAMVFGTKSTYKDGASIRKRTAYGASHLLQWEVIKWIKDQGATLHDLCGAPPSDEINNKNHPHYGIGLFKTGFNKTVTEYIGAYDIVVRPFAYKLWAKFGERLVRRLYYRRHRQSYF